MSFSSVLWQQKEKEWTFSNKLWQVKNDVKKILLFKSISRRKKGVNCCREVRCFVTGVWFVRQNSGCCRYAWCKVTVYEDLKGPFNSLTCQSQFSCHFRMKTSASCHLWICAEVPKNCLSWLSWLELRNCHKILGLLGLCCFHKYLCQFPLQIFISVQQ